MNNVIKINGFKDHLLSDLNTYVYISNYWSGIQILDQLFMCNLISLNYVGFDPFKDTDCTIRIW